MDLHKQYRRRGVTLIEAIMVVTLLSAAALACSFVLDRDWSSSRNVQQVTSHVSHVLLMARNTALANRADVEVRRVRNGNTEQIEIAEFAGPFRAERRSTFDLGDDIRISGSPSRIRFTPESTADRSLQWTIRQGNSSAEINLNATNTQLTTRLP